MEVTISYISSTDEENFNHVSNIEHSPTEGITLQFEGPDGSEYGSTTIKGFDGEHGRAYVKSADKEDHEE